MELKMIELKDIIANPLQPRQNFDKEKLQELANSIKEGELLQPIVVRKNNGGKFEIVCGERRYKAFQILKEKQIPAIVRNIEDDVEALEKGTIENWHRVNLSEGENEQSLVELWKSGRYPSIRDMANKTGINQGTLSAIINANEVRHTLSCCTDNVSWRDIDRTKSLKNYPETRKELLEKRGRGEIKALDLEDEAQRLLQVELGELLPEVFTDDPDQSRYSEIDHACFGILRIIPAHIDAIENEKYRERALNKLKITYEHLYELLKECNIIVEVEINGKEKPCKGEEVQ